MSIQARDGASRADLDVILASAMAAWDPLGARRVIIVPAPVRIIGADHPCGRCVRGVSRWPEVVYCAQGADRCPLCQI
jgi:hypothetical protein